MSDRGGGMSGPANGTTNPVVERLDCGSGDGRRDISILEVMRPGRDVFGRHLNDGLD